MRSRKKVAHLRRSRVAFSGANGTCLPFHFHPRKYDMQARLTEKKKKKDAVRGVDRRTQTTIRCLFEIRALACHIPNRRKWSKRRIPAHLWGGRGMCFIDIIVHMIIDHLCSARSRNNKVVRDRCNGVYIDCAWWKTISFVSSNILSPRAMCVRWKSESQPHIWFASLPVCGQFFLSLCLYSFYNPHLASACISQFFVTVWIKLRNKFIRFGD